MSPHPPRPAADVEAMRARYLQGESLDSIGADFGVSKQRVYQLIHPTPAERTTHELVVKGRRDPPLKRASRARPPHPCPVCGKPTQRKTYCSPEHAEVARRDKHRTYQARTIMRAPEKYPPWTVAWAQRHLEGGD